MFLSRKKSVEAKRVGATLVAAFHNSSPSLVWSFDLERNHSFTLTLQGEEGDFELGVTSPKGDFYPVARFVAREDAEEALAAVQKVLMKKKCAWFQALLKWVGALALLAVLALLLGSFAVSRGLLHLALPGAASTVAPAIPNGVPLPADQVLRPPP